MLSWVLFFEEGAVIMDGDLLLCRREDTDAEDLLEEAAQAM